MSQSSNVKNPFISFVPNVTDTRSLESLSTLLDLSVEGLYPGETRTKMSPNGKHIIPKWTMRTAILYYCRKTVGKAIMWLELSMGVVGNTRSLFQDKRMADVWKESNPVKFKELEKYFPMTWSDLDSFHYDMEEGSLYVYKPLIGYGGEGILFMNGLEMYTELKKKKDRGSTRGWIVQEFVDPFLVNEKKSHSRVLTLIMIQPDGSREFYIYNKMRIFTAPEKFDKKRLVDGGDNTHMLITNMHQNKVVFDSDPNNRGKRFSSDECVLDEEFVVGKERFEYIYSEMRDLHSIIYSTMGDMIECSPTDVSIYSEACFNIMASDIAFDKNGKAYFLEINHDMAFNGVWTPEEQLSFSNGVAAIARTDSPFSVDDSSMWEKLVMF